MILRQEPDDLEKYVKISDMIFSYHLQENGIHPIYFWNGCHWYLKDEKLYKYLQEERGENEY